LDLVIAVNDDEDLRSPLTTPSMAEYDLSRTIIQYLDRHLAFPVLDHLAKTNLFPEEDVQIAQYELAKGTNMVDFAAQLFQSVWPHHEIPSGAFLGHRL
jgi:translation initiation factor 3 subunit E